MRNKVIETIDAYGMISPGECILVGISGGADSTALLHILKELRSALGISVAAAHVNHGLRGAAGDEDAAFAASLCRDWDIPYYQRTVDILSHAAAWKVSVEEAGRRFRYAFFEETAGLVGAAKTATAHHMNDQAETILHRIIRGTGIKGLGGIQPIREGRIIRPLLAVSRSEIEVYLKDHQLRYRTDATNQENDYTRNRIRNLLIPDIERAYNPAFTHALVRMGETAREDDDYLNDCAQNSFNTLARLEGGNIYFPLREFLALHNAIRKRLLLLALHKLRPQAEDIGYRHLEAALTLAVRGQPGSRIDLPGSLWVLKGYEELCLLPMHESRLAPVFNLPLTVPGWIDLEEGAVTITAEAAADPVLSNDTRCIYIDGDAVRGCLRVRQRRPGDRFRPLGMRGTKKLKDFFIDSKIPRELRDRIPLVVDDDNIIWIAGWQMSEDYKISRGSRNIVKLKIKYQK